MNMDKGSSEIEIGANRRRRNILLKGRRTSLALEQQVWDAILEICSREDLTLDELCAHVADRRVNSSVSSAIRVFLLTYYRQISSSLERGQSLHIHDESNSPDSISPMMAHILTVFAEQQAKFAAE